MNKKILIATIILGIFLIAGITAGVTINKDLGLTNEEKSLILSKGYENIRVGNERYVEGRKTSADVYVNEVKMGKIEVYNGYCEDSYGVKLNINSELIKRDCPYWQEYSESELNDEITKKIKTILTSKPSKKSVYTSNEINIDIKDIGFVGK